MNSRFLIPISLETKLGVFKLPFVRWSVSRSVSQSVSHTSVSAVVKDNTATPINS